MKGGSSAKQSLVLSAASVALGSKQSSATLRFTATTLLIGSFGKVSATHVGLRWNGGYFLITATLLSLWVCVYGLLL